MAQNRRGSGRGGFRPPELKDLRGTIGTLISSALSQATTVRDRIDTYRSNQRRTDALAELGEIVLDLIRRGEIDLAELPEARRIVRELDELDVASGDEGAREIPRPSSRERFDTRGHDHPHAHPHPHRHTHDDDGTASSRSWTPPKPSKPAARVWRPVEPDDTTPVVDEAPPPPAVKPAPRKGGISFGNDSDDDDDLEQYMHPDDVPAKPRPDE